MKLALLAIAATLAFQISYAAPKCTTEAKDKWLSEIDMKKKVEEMGFKIKTFKVAGDCYEIYGTNKDGKKAEVYFNPVDGSIVKSYIK